MICSSVCCTWCFWGWCEHRGLKNAIQVKERPCSLRPQKYFSSSLSLFAFVCVCISVCESACVPFLLLLIAWNHLWTFYHTLLKIEKGSELGSAYYLTTILTAPLLLTITKQTSFQEVSTILISPQRALLTQSTGWFINTLSYNVSAVGTIKMTL